MENKIVVPIEFTSEQWAKLESMSKQYPEYKDNPKQYISDFIHDWIQES